MSSVPPTPTCSRYSNGVQDEWRRREDMKNIGRRLVHMLENDMFHDVTFVVGQNRTSFTCHKLVLLASSKVFMAMFTGDLAAKPNEQIQIPDIEPEPFIASVEYLYSGYLSIEEDRLPEVLYIAVKYDLSHLVECCSELMIRQLNSKNALSMYQTAKFFKTSYLLYGAYRYIRKHPQIILQSDDFLNLSLENLTTIISQDDFIVDDLDVFHAIIKWGENQCDEKGIPPTGENIREVLGDSIYQIRFSRVLPSQISQFVIPKNIYTFEEMVQIYQCSSLPAIELEHLPEIKFTFKDRVQPLYGIKLFEDIPESEIKDANINCMKKTIRFNVDRDIVITSLILHGLPENANATYKVEICLKMFDSTHFWNCIHAVIAIGVKGFGCLRMNLSSHLTIYKGCWYQISLETQATVRTQRSMTKDSFEVSCGENGEVTFSMDSMSQKAGDPIEFFFRFLV